YRPRTCFINADTESFADECVDPPLPPGKVGPLVYLWGDSHAADLYPGLHQLQAERLFRIAQFTAGRGPPLVGAEVADVPGCGRVNRGSLQRIERLRPDWVIISGQWVTIHVLGVQLSQLDDTIAALKKIGVPNILLVGPVPSWGAGAGLPR